MDWRGLAAEQLITVYFRIWLERCDWLAANYCVFQYMAGEVGLR